MDHIFNVILYLLCGFFVAVIINAFTNIGDPFYLFIFCLMIALSIYCVVEEIKVRFHKEDD